MNRRPGSNFKKQSAIRHLCDQNVALRDVDRNCCGFPIVPGLFLDVAGIGSMAVPVITRNPFHHASDTDINTAFAETAGCLPASDVKGQDIEENRP